MDTELKFFLTIPFLKNKFFRFQFHGILFLLFLLFQKLFIHGLYQLQNISFICSVYQTVVLAFQRYLAISKPIEYYISQSTASTSMY